MKLVAAGCAGLLAGGLVLVQAQAQQVQGTAEELVLKQEDLPGTFAIAGGDYQPDGSYVAMYMRPEVLASPRLPEGALLGVLANVVVLADQAAASTSFADGSSEQSVLDSLEQSGRSGGSVQTLDAGLGDADAAALFRVEYRLQGIHVIEYRYRMRLANAVASVMISARAGDGGREPPALAGDARSMATRQLERMAAFHSGSSIG